MNDKKVYIIILNYNGWLDTIECLESILKSSYTNYQIIVVDNNSPNNSIDFLIKWAQGKLNLWLPDSNLLKMLSFPLEKKPLKYVVYSKEEALLGGNPKIEKKFHNPIIFIRSDENRGFAAGNNLGIKYALAKGDFEYVWLLNNDTVIPKDTLNHFVQSMESNDEVILLGSVQYYYNNPNIIQAVGGGFNKYRASFWNYQSIEKYNKIDYIYGASMFFKKIFFEKIGLLNEKYFLYYEEIDLAERLKQTPFVQKVDKNIKIYHKHSGTISKEHTFFREYFLEKNKIVFYKKYYPLLIWIPLLKLFFKYIRTLDIRYLKIMRDGIFQ